MPIYRKVLPRFLPVLLALIIHVMVMPGPATAAENESWTRCMQGSPDVRIGGCTALIRSGRLGTRDLAAALSNRCGAHSDAGQLDLAYKDCNESIRLDRSIAATFLNRQATYYRDKSLPQAKMFELAFPDINEAIRLDPRAPRAWYNRGVLYFLKAQQAGQSALLDQAIADFSQAIALQPGYASAWYGRSRAKARKGDAGGAQADEAKARALGFGKKS